MSKVLLCILDGWGIGDDPTVDAIQQANTPFMDHAIENFPSAQLVTYGQDVGLPKGQMGNSEVGHLNIGAGRVVYQDLAKINKAIEDETLAKNAKLLEAIENCAQQGQPFHLMGLLSDGGVHSHIEHLLELVNILDHSAIEEVYIHAFLDGRDTDPKSGASYLATLLAHLEGTRVKLASVVGRYYAMDRDHRWERIKKTYDLLVHGQGHETTDIVADVKQAYENDITDEFMDAHSIDPNGVIKQNDTVLFFNFRSDRPRQISEVLTQQDHPDHDMQKLELNFYTMTEYDASFRNVHVLFEKNKLVNTIGSVISAAGKTQLRIAETEKYPHVTFFFSGGREEPYDGEERIMIPSPKVATYDLEPEMSAIGITNALTDAIQKSQPDFICVNYANTDMVGHTGDFDACMIAAETVDQCVNRVCKVALDHEYQIIIIADHGNSDYMINTDGSPHTAHTTNMVPVVLVSNNAAQYQIKDGKLGDIAPTILKLMQLDSPAEMDGDVLV